MGSRKRHHHRDTDSSSSSSSCQISSKGAQPDEQAIKQYVADLELKLDGYETILGKQAYLAGGVSALIR